MLFFIYLSIYKLTLSDDDFAECEVSLNILFPEPDHHIAPSLSAALAPKCLLALERRFTVISADLVVSKLGRRPGVRDGDIKVVQTPVCKYQSEKKTVSSEKLIHLSVQLAKNTRTICGITLLKCGYSLNITYSDPARVSESCYCIACMLLSVLYGLYTAESI